MAAYPSFEGGSDGGGAHPFVRPWTGGFVYRGIDGLRSGLFRILSYKPELEAIRVAKHVCSPLLAAASAVGLALRQFRMYRTAKMNPSADRHDLEVMVNRGMEDFGAFRLAPQELPVNGFRSEFNLLLTCAFWTLFGNSVQYEFGYRWYHQTQYDEKFKESYLDFLDVKAIEISAQEFALECESVPAHTPASTLSSERVMPSREPESEVLSDIAEVLAFTAEGENDFSSSSLVEFVEEPLAKVAAIATSKNFNVPHLRKVGWMFSARYMSKWCVKHLRRSYKLPKTDRYTPKFEFWEGEFLRRRLMESSHNRHRTRDRSMTEVRSTGFCRTISDYEGVDEPPDGQSESWSHIGKTSAFLNDQDIGSGLSSSILSSVLTKRSDGAFELNLVFRP